MIEGNADSIPGFFEGFKKEGYLAKVDPTRKMVGALHDKIASISPTYTGSMEKSVQATKDEAGKLNDASQEHFGVSFPKIPNPTDAQIQQAKALARTAGSAVVSGVKGVAELGFDLSPAAPFVKIAKLGLLAVKSTTNREAEHTNLLPYVFNLIDGERPRALTGDGLDKAATAAAYLMAKGSIQFLRLEEKLNHDVKLMYEAFAQYARLTGDFDDDVWPPKTIRPGSTDIAAMKADFYRINLNKTIADDFLANSVRANGGIWTGLRRLIHFGNYLQCQEIISLQIYLGIDPNYVTSESRVDPFGTWDAGIKYRERIAEVANRIQVVKTRYEGYEKKYYNGFACVLNMAMGTKSGSQFVFHTPAARGAEHTL
jgi:hypothetical protein